ncbi:hypothetical protein KIN20_010430 [Parelaphostrongylus tenuis]|uniref:Uncharacterized protein n=1 Tax=Parelaphostrongylus tenuis TaxID=148309 RepID=A0AAD5MTD8_PARTN|nr:hypothetical protein KIN20_010430 [Parelaphostrongylus tenuis]
MTARHGLQLQIIAKQGLNECIRTGRSVLQHLALQHNLLDQSTYLLQRPTCIFTRTLSAI